MIIFVILIYILFNRELLFLIFLKIILYSDYLCSCLATLRNGFLLVLFFNVHSSSSDEVIEEISFFQIPIFASISKSKLRI